MSDDALEAKLKSLAANERRITSEIVTLIQMAEGRGLPLKRGYTSTLDWMIKGLLYSESAAHRRLSAARLSREVPEISERLSEGILSLTNVAKVESAIRKQEKLSKSKISPEEKAELVQKFENQTGAEADRTLYELLPAAVEAIKLDRLQQIDPNRSRLTIILDQTTVEQLEKIRGLLGGRLSNMSWSELISYLVGEFLKRKDPSRKIASRKSRSSTAAVKQCATARKRLRIPAEARREVWRRAQSQCEYVDPSTSRACKSKFLLEVDHILPVAKGGTNAPDNLRLLCRAHNQYCANVEFGSEFMRKKRSYSSA